MAKNVFHRLEYKYVLTQTKYDSIINIIKEKLEVDFFGNATIQSLYFDTPNYRLIRESIEKPMFKEKLRLRSYGIVGERDLAFLEMKRKSEGVVYKRRIKATEEFALDFIAKKNDGYNDQISKELKYFRDYYADLKPVVLLIYDREAYQSKDLRITFDTNIRYRFNDLNLSTSLEGKPLDEGTIMMEIKTIHAMPLWLVELLSENQIYKSSYSKYGKTYITKILKGENK